MGATELSIEILRAPELRFGCKKQSEPNDSIYYHDDCLCALMNPALDLHTRSTGKGKCLAWRKPEQDQVHIGGEAPG